VHAGLVPHLHTPPLQLSAFELEHWLFVPHLQPPLVQLSARVIEQVVQVPPSFPQAVKSVPLQSLPEQHPPEQEVALHTQVPPVQTWPTLHCGLEPHAQPPSAPHESAPVVLQVVQRPPSMPQFCLLGASHWFDLQQPPEQLVASHLQPLPVQSCPSEHIVPPLQVQAPPELQPLASTGLHAAQALPPVPHCIAVRVVMQVLPLQQPVLQLPEVQLPPVQAWLTQLPVPQLAQAAPPVPQEPASVPAWHTPLESQQPLGQEVESHWQVPPLTQWVPASQGPPEPHLQVPLVEPQWSVSFGSHVWHATPLRPHTLG